MKRRVAALETSTLKVLVESASSVPVSSLVLNPAQIAATYAQTTKQIAATVSAIQCEAILQGKWQR